MADEGKVVIELVGKDSATRTFVKSFQDMQATFQRLEASSRSSAASLTSIEKNAMLAGNAVGSMTAKLLTLAGASYVGFRVASGFQEAIKSIDNYKTQVIQIASTLTSLSEKGQGPIGEQFGRNLAYAEQMYRAINVESAKHFASANNMMTVYNRLTQEGYGVRLQEVGALGQMTDLIKMYTGDQQLEKQLNQEIRSLLNGQARATDAVAMSLKAQLGPGWATLVEKHRQAGDLLQWIVSLYPGLEAATGQITETWSAQFATAQSLLQLLSIDGLGGAYAEIVNWLKQGNEYLRQHGEELAGRIQTGWQNISPIVFGVANAVVRAADAGLRFAESLERISQNPAFMALFGAAAGSRFGPWGAVVGGFAGAGTGVGLGIKHDAAAYQAQLQREKSGLIGYGSEGEGYVSGAKTAIPTILRKPPGAGGGGGAAAAKSAADDVEKELEKAKRATESARKEAQAAEMESWRFSFDLQQRAIKATAERVKLEHDAVRETSTLWQDVMSNEGLSYQDRLSAAEHYKAAHIQVIDDEINAIKAKYGALVTADSLESYRNSQIVALDKKIATTLNPEAFSWESAWKKAAENVQTSLADTLYTLATQTKTTGDIITNITQGILKIISEMAAQSIMNVAKMALQSTSWGGGGNILSSLFGGLFGGGMDYSMQSGASVPFAYGAAFQKFDRGDVLTRPTVFPMATGYGLMAEAGPEAAMPLTRTSDGYLGVRAVGTGGGGDFKFTIVNKTSAPVGQATGRRISDREFLIELDEAVGGLIAGNGRAAAAVDRRQGQRLTVR